MARNNNIPWARVAVESTAIVASILLAFAIEAAWQTRNERIEERDALQSLLSEFEANRAVIDSSIEAHGRHAASAERVLGMSLGYIPVSEDFLEVIRVAFISYRSTNYAGGTLTAILSSGGISVIRNPELRRKIAAWPSILEEATEDEQVVVRVREQVLIPFLVRRLPAFFVEQQFLPPEFQTGEALSQFRALLGDDELEAVVALSAGLRRGGPTQDLVSARDYLDELIELIAAEEGVESAGGGSA